MLKKYEENNIQAIADKIREKTGTDKTYYTSEMASGIDEVFEAGRGDVLNNSKYIEKSVTGKLISINDVSEVYHKVKVYGDGEVDVYGKNLFNNDVSLIKEINYTSSSGNYTRYGYEIELPAGTYTVRAISKESSFSDVYLYGYVVDKNNNVVGGTAHIVVNNACQTKTFTLNEGGKLLQVDGTTTDLSHAKKDFAKFDIILEAGTFETPYEEYKGCQTIIATSTGTEVNSMCPNMTFIADSDITVDYYSSFGMAEKELDMWNALTNYGKRTSFANALSYSDYSGFIIPEGLYRPTKVIGQMCYVYQGVELPRGIDCSGFDVTTTTQSYHMYNTFAYAPNLKYVYDIGVPAGVLYIGTYRSCSSLETIEIIRCNEQTIFDANCFNGCSKLTHCIFSGVIANDINLQWSKSLDDESLISLITHLKVYTSSDSGYGTKTLTLSPESWNRLGEIYYEVPVGAITLLEYFDSLGWNRA